MFNSRCLTLFNPPNTHGHIIWIIYVLTACRRLGLRLKAGLVWITGPRMRQDSHSLSTLICRQRWRERQEEKRRRKRWWKRWERRFLDSAERFVARGEEPRPAGLPKGRLPKVCWEYIDPNVPTIEKWDEVFFTGMECTSWHPQM